MNRERIQGYLDTSDTYGTGKENRWVPTRESFRQLCHLALLGLEQRSNVPETLAWCEQASKVLASPSATALKFEPTHRHAEGGLYRFVSNASYKPLTLDWSDAVIYEAENRKLYVTTPVRWKERFTMLAIDTGKAG